MVIHRMFKYLSGEPVKAGDRIGYDALDGSGVVLFGVVVAVLSPGSHEAAEYGRQQEGGILLSFDDGDFQLWEAPDSHLTLVESNR